MRIVKPNKLGLIYKTYATADGFRLSVGAVQFFDFDNPEALLSEQDFWNFLGEELEGDAVFDAAVPKIRGEVLVHGRAFAPGGELVGTLDVGLEIGAISKRLAVFGDRVWRPTSYFDVVDVVRGNEYMATVPEPFAEMDLGPRNTFGGEGFARNPGGKGLIEEGQHPDPDAGSPLPNVEDPDQLVDGPWAVPEPAGFGPLDLMHPDRQAKFGTCDDRWARTIYPADPSDTDPAFYNTAREDQQINGFWRGDESFVAINMHPDEPRLEGRLPGYRPRCFVAFGRDGDGQFWREISLDVETIWLFPNRKRGAVVCRGVTEIGDLTGRGVEHLLLAYERGKGETRTPADYRESVERRLDDETALEWMAREDDLSPPEGVPEIEFDIEDEEAAGKWPPPPPEVKQALDQAKVELAKTRALAVEAGVELPEHLDEDKLDLSLEPPEYKIPAFRKMSDIGAVLAFGRKEEARLNRIFEEAEQQVEQHRAEAMDKLEQAQVDARKIAEEAGLDYDELLAKAQAEPPPDLAQKLEEVKQSVLAQGAPAEAQSQIDEAIVKLEQVRPDLDRAMLIAKNPALDPEIKPMLRQVAHHAPPQELPSADEATALGATVRDRVAENEGASFVNQDLTGADLAGAELSGVDFTDAILTSANLSGADLSGAILNGAILALANLEGTVLVGAKLTEASLGQANLRGADLTQADLTDAVMAGADLTDAKLCGAVLSLDFGHEITAVGTDFSEASAAESTFLECNLTGARFRGAELTKSTFLECKLSGCDFDRARLSSTTFVQAEAQRCTMREAEIESCCIALESDFSGSDFTGANATGANFRGAGLRCTIFEGSTVDNADFSEADLGEARFTGASARATRFMHADLTDAHFERVNLMQGSLLGAALVRTDFTGANLFETETLFANPDNALLRRTHLVRCKLADAEEDA